jgi:hypothetical protein
MRHAPSACVSLGLSMQPLLGDQSYTWPNEARLSDIEQRLPAKRVAGAVPTSGLIALAGKRGSARCVQSET